MSSLKKIHGAGAVKLASSPDMATVLSFKMLMLFHAPSVLMEASTVSLSFLQNSRRSAGDAGRNASRVLIKLMAARASMPVIPAKNSELHAVLVL
jgi:hypothetical protein